MNTKIFLLGFMGSGKTTIGKKLANQLTLPFIDLDKAIEAHTNQSIDIIFKLRGEDEFRRIEHETLTNLIKSEKNFVMSLGGGTPCFHDNIDLINKNGTTVYLKYNSGILTSRLINAIKDRPLIKNKSKEEMASFIEQLLKKRELFYNKSNHIVEGNNIKTEDILAVL